MATTSPHNLTPSNLIISEEFSPGSSITLYLGDRLELLDSIKRSGVKAELVITSPPYDLGKEYERKIPLDEYLDGQQKTIAACLDILAPNGNIVWLVGSHIEGQGRDKEVYPLDALLYPIFKGFGLRMHNSICWTFNSGLHDTYRFSGRHETLLWFSAQSDYIYNLDAVRVPQKYPNKRGFRGERKGQLTSNPLGKNPGDVWEFVNILHNQPEKVGHPCQTPLGLIERVVLALSNPGGLVVDPYMGSGTTAVACAMHDRRAAGADIMPKYLMLARERLLKVATSYPVNLPD